MRNRTVAGIERKEISAREFKVDDGEPPGTISGYLNRTGVIDHGGDRVHRNAFAQTIKDAYARRAQEGGDQLWPLLWSHNTEIIPPGNIVSAWEDNQGLFIKARLNLDYSLGADLYSAFRHQTVKGLSIGYRATETSYSHDTASGKTIREIKTVELLEGSVVLMPMSPGSQITSVKKGGASMFGKSFDSNYQAQQLDDWQYGDWSGISSALQQSILGLFAPGRAPLADFNSEVAPQLLAALRAYIQEGVDLGFSTAPTSAQDVYMMSLSGAGDESKAGYLSAQHHATIKEATQNIMKHTRAIQRVSDALEAQRRNDLQGYPIARSTSSDTSYFEEKEAEEASRSQIKHLSDSLEMDLNFREIRAITAEMGKLAQSANKRG